MTFTVKVLGIGSGGRPAHFGVATHDGHTFEFISEGVELGVAELERAAPMFISSFIKESGLTDHADIIAAIETKTFKV